jgi:hypothetical protein
MLYELGDCHTLIICDEIVKESRWSLDMESRLEELLAFGVG